MPALAAPPATVRTRDGLDLFVRHWPAARPRGRILMVHGLGEHSGRYEHVAAHLVAHDWDVVSYDHRGHGASPGKRGALHADDDLVADLTSVFEAVQPDVPCNFAMLGHSMGGLIAAQFVAEERGVVHALILTSPALDAGLGFAQRIQLAIGRALVPDLAMSNQLDATKISHDPEVVRRYIADPLVHDRVTARLVRSLVDGGAAVLAAAPSWTTYTLLLWAGSDRLVSPAGSAAFAATARKQAVTAQCFDGLYHEIMNELDASPVFAAIDAWLDPRRGPT